ncbi:hypothetical protein Aperf_G00000095893 [Anoplocephala perfoliata]
MSASIENPHLSNRECKNANSDLCFHKPSNTADEMLNTGKKGILSIETSIGIVLSLLHIAIGNPNKDSELVIDNANLDNDLAIGKMNLDIELAIGNMNLDIELAIGNMNLDNDLAIGNMNLDNDLAIGNMNLDNDLAIGNMNLDNDLAIGNMNLDIEVAIGNANMDIEVAIGNANMDIELAIGNADMDIELAIGRHRILVADRVRKNLLASLDTIPAPFHGTHLVCILHTAIGSPGKDNDMAAAGQCSKEVGMDEASLESIHGDNNDKTHPATGENLEAVSTPIHRPYFRLYPSCYREEVELAWALLVVETGFDSVVASLSDVVAVIWVPSWSMAFPLVAVWKQYFSNFAIARGAAANIYCRERSSTLL